MPEAEPKKIVYLFGAGATHAELQNIDPDLAEEKSGLLTTNVSKRVIEKARRGARYLRGLEMVSSTSGSLNIELLISLIENSKIQGWDYKSRRLKRLVEEDINTILTGRRTRRFYLHKALFELHNQEVTKAKEEVTGLISLNYDDVLDQAYEEYYRKPNYCFSLEPDAPSSSDIPLLKLHGSFNWSRRTIRGRRRKIEIIPLGSSKSYLHTPYNFIWNRALETLIGCDTLRVIGCSLSQNDFHLVDLLFKAHLERSEAFGIEIISSAPAGEGIQQNYGFFPNIKTLEEIGSQLGLGLVPAREPPNPFAYWLYYKSIKVLGPDRMGRTRYLKKLAG
jgi:hypothetical protein